jgi:multidrug resistance efflux pump
LARQGAASEIEALRAEESASLAEEELLALREQVAEIGVQIADRKHSYGAERVERDFRVREAEVGLAEAKALAVLGSVLAPETGRVESLLVSEGQVVQAGSILARIVPDGTASCAVVFAPAKDASFLRVGLEASLEFPSLPVSEYGKARAKVTRVASDKALPAEVSDVLGADPGASSGLVRLEMNLVNDATWKKMAPRLHSGAHVIARLETRKRRIITLLFDFLRTWYPD